MKQNQRNQTGNITTKKILIAAAVVAAAALIGFLIWDETVTSNNLGELNEIIYETGSRSGSAVGYTLTYKENAPDQVTKVEREAVYSLSEEGVTFHEVTSSEGTTPNEIFVRPGQYYSLTEDGKTWEKTETGQALVPYSTNRIARFVTPDQMKRITKEENGYRVTYNRQWLTSSFVGEGKPIASEIFFETTQVGDKTVLTTVTQTMTTRSEDQSVNVFEEVNTLTVDTTQDGKNPTEVLDQFFAETVEGNWVESERGSSQETGEDAQQDAPDSQPTVGESGEN